MVYCIGNDKKRGCRMQICCFTGHRTLPKARAVELVRLLDGHIAALYEQGVREFRTGGARGFDTLAALRVLALRDKHPDCRLSLYLPCITQSDAWPAGDRALYQDILAKADEVHYVKCGFLSFLDKVKPEEKEALLAFTHRIVDNLQ